MASRVSYQFVYVPYESLSLDDMGNKIRVDVSCTTFGKWTISGYPTYGQALNKCCRLKSVRQLLVSIIKRMRLIANPLFGEATSLRDVLY